jgi:CrcB protein
VSSPFNLRLRRNGGCGAFFFPLAWKADLLSTMRLKTEYLWIALGSALGGVARYWLSGMIADRLGKVFPWNTLAVNVTGSFVIGVIAAAAGSESRIDPHLRPFVVQFLMVGICGGYTTFSSFSLQTLNLLQEGQWLYAGVNVLLSVALCLVGVWVGYFVGQFINR